MIRGGEDDLCIDEGCPHYGTPHTCEGRVETDEEHAKRVAGNPYHERETALAIGIVAACNRFPWVYRDPLARFLPDGFVLSEGMPLVRAIEIVLSRVKMYDAMATDLKALLASERDKAAKKARKATPPALGDPA